MPVVKVTGKSVARNEGPDSGDLGDFNPQNGKSKEIKVTFCRGDQRITATSEMVQTRSKDAYTLFGFNDRGCRRSLRGRGSHEREREGQMGAGAKKELDSNRRKNVWIHTVLQAGKDAIPAK